MSIMEVIARRTVLVGAGVVAGASLAAALLLRKPPGPPVLTLRPDAAPEAVHLQSLDALRPVDPPRALPEIVYTDADGTPHGLRDLRGRMVVLNLWATWCPPCVAEMPSLAALARAAGADVAVLPLSSDHGGAAVVARFYRDHGITGLPVALDPKGAALEALGARGLPTTLILDAEGRERGRLEGAADWAAPAALSALRRLTA
jgi:thiol-disulfide isomerase/thioredoxin